MRSNGGISRILTAAGGYGLLGAALAANLCEGYAKGRIASDGGKMLDAIIARNPAPMLGNFLAVLVFIALMAGGIFVKDSLLGMYLEKGMVRLRQKTLRSLNEARMSWLDGYHTGRLSARVMADLNALGGALRPVLIMGISVIVYECVCIAFMLITSWLLTVIVFAIMPLTMLLQWLSSHPIRKYRSANQDAVAVLTSVVFDCFGSFETVKSLTLEEEMRARFENAQAKQVDAAVREARITAALTFFSGVNRYLPYLALLAAGGAFVLGGKLSLGQLTMFIALSSGVIWMLGDIGELFASIRQLGACADRIAELWDAPKEAPAVLMDNNSINLCSQTGAALCFEQTGFGYAENGEKVLSELSFTVPRGSFTALVGESGCGKSTAIKLAVSLYVPNEGSVYVLGREIRDWDISSLRSRIAYVTQDTYLFPGSLADNIFAGADGVRDDHFWNCIQAAQLLPFVESLPEGIDTEAGERGVFLSGGQRQRISIARALYKKAELLFLDEATSALDRSTEEAVLRGILSMKERPALVAITHSLANARSADCIVVMSWGRVVEKGTHDELCRLNGEYARFLERQKEDITF